MIDYRELITDEHFDRVVDWLEGGQEIIPHHEFKMEYWEDEQQPLEDNSMYCHTSACLYGSAVMLAMVDALGRKPTIREIMDQTHMYTWSPEFDWDNSSAYRQSLNILFEMYPLTNRDVAWLYRRIDNETGVWNMPDWNDSPLDESSRNNVISSLEAYEIQYSIEQPVLIELPVLQEVES